MFHIARKLGLPLTLLGIGAGAILATSTCVRAQGERQPAPAVKIGAPVLSTPAVMPPASDKAPTAEPAVLPSQTKEGVAQPKDSPQPSTAPFTEVVVEGAAPKSAWLDNPKVAFIPRPGFFAVLPTGPGYYSLLDLVTGNYRENPPKFGYPRFGVGPIPNFDTDWRYVDQPGYDADVLEKLHRIHVGDDWLFATGGEFRFRYYDEKNSRLSGNNNQYELTRVRVFGDIWYKDAFRIYVEGMSSQDFNYNPKLAPTLIDRDYLDLLNAFVDVKIFENQDCVPWYVRVGRQELCIGSQRLVSALDWANTRRTFDGVRVFNHGEKLDIDLWWTRPVIPNVTRFDSSDQNQNFFGAWTEYRPTKTQALDLYYMYLDNSNNYNFAAKTPAPVGQFPIAPYRVSTIGYRYSGNVERNKNILFDSENVLQFGKSNFTGGDIFAGASTTGLGYNFCQVPMNPTFWAYFDYASGSRNLKVGQDSTFNQLYPFGHYYFGGIDYIGRANILDLNFHGYLYPTKWLTLNAQYHFLQLASATDALYNAGGAVLRYDPTGKAGRSVGEELTLIANFHLTPRQDIFLQYSHLHEGRFLQQTGTGGQYAETFWLMYNVRW
jgi:hypothetical protein